MPGCHGPPRLGGRLRACHRRQADADRRRRPRHRRRPRGRSTCTRASSPGSARGPSAPGTTSQALELLDTERPDLILLDLGLPDMDGCRGPRRVACSAATHDVPVVVISGRTGVRGQHRALQPGVSTSSARVSSRPTRPAPVSRPPCRAVGLYVASRNSRCAAWSASSRSTTPSPSAATSGPSRRHQRRLPDRLLRAGAGCHAHGLPDPLSHPARPRAARNDRPLGDHRGHGRGLLGRLALHAHLPSRGRCLASRVPARTAAVK